MNLHLNTFLTGAALAGACVSASALTVGEGNVPQDDQSNVVRNPCNLPDSTGSGSPVFGCLNDNHSFLVSLSSDESLEITGGQSTLDSTDGTFSQLTVAATGLTSVILNIDATEDGFVTFTGDGTFALDADGENFFTATGLTDSLSFTTFNSQMIETDIVADVNQIRVGVIPEPETYALMLAGLGAVGFIARRRKLRAD